MFRPEKARKVEDDEKERLITSEDPGKYNIILHKNELEDINKIIRTFVNNSQFTNDTSKQSILRKKAQKIDSLTPRFTLMVTESGTYLNFYVIGDGKREKEKNAYLGSGTNYGSLVKVCVKLEEKDGRYDLSNEIYAVKKYNTIKPEMVKEIEMIKKVYGFGEIIFDNQKGKTYVIMPKMSGVELKDIDYHNMDLNEFQNLLSSILQEVRNVHDKGVAHNDLNPRNIFYDKTTHQVYISDFGDSTELTADSIKTDYEGVAYSIMDVIANYLESHVTLFDFLPDGNKLRESKMEEFALGLSEIANEAELKHFNPEHTLASLAGPLGEIRDFVSKPVEIQASLLDGLSPKQVGEILTKSIKSNNIEVFTAVLPFCNPEFLNKVQDKKGNSLLEIANDKPAFTTMLLGAGVVDESALSKHSNDIGRKSMT